MKKLLALLLAAVFAVSLPAQVQNMQAASGTTGDLTKPTGGFNLASGQTQNVKSGATVSGAGNFDFSSATKLIVPNGAAPTTSAFGWVAGDNNAWASSRGALQVYDGTANTYLIGALASSTPTNGQVPQWNTGGTITWVTPSAGVSGANPSASVGLSAVNGSATTYMRSDGAPALSQSITPTWTGAHIFAANATFGAASGTTGATVYKGTTSGTVTITVNDVAGTWTGKWPATAGTNGYSLTTNGSGVFAWTNITGGGSPGGSNTQVQFNDSSAFGGDAGLTYDKATGILAVASGSLTNNIVQNSQSTAYTLVLADAGKHIYHPSADTTARVWTIPANSSVAYPIGTSVTFINDTSGGTITISITTDTLVLAGTGSTGSRTLTANGIATAIKVTSTRWLINGVNLN